MSGHIFQINISPGGVPKMPIPAGQVGALGLEGDHQRNRRHHGGPERALCLLALETILELQREGHPIYPGATGENITTAGIDLGAIAPGARLRLGAEVVIEITGYAAPCRSISGSFAGQTFGRLSHKTHPGASRLYARVLCGGAIAIGAAIELIAEQ